jgi:polyhydroxybutyrate depolymerase
MRFRRTALLFAAVAVVLVIARSGAQASGDSIEHRLTVDGRERSYLVFAPPRRDAASLAVMLVLHGGLGNAEGVDRLYGMNEVAAREGFIAVYPNGPRIGNVILRQRRSWNAGACCGPAAEQGVDDVGFIRAMLDALVADYGIDRGMVYVSGMSNGAMMAYRLVCEAPELIAAAIPVAGALVLDDCAGGRDVPVLHIHGADDANVPVAGGIGDRSLVDLSFRSLDATLDLLAADRACAEPVTSHDEPGITAVRYDCSAGAPIVARILAGVGHTWPGADPRLLQRERYTGEFSASEAAWAFAREFRR